MSDADSLKVAFTRPSLGQEEENAVLEVMRSGWLTTGKTALQFENDFSQFLMQNFWLSYLMLRMFSMVICSWVIKMK